ncbi:MAG: YD repeat protein [Candidatus Collierbacteria bacterium GW2011_GWB1_44_6]|uniref:YD repeat protein n=1 Tax=Candidatus Collierbacteria bacterium GW2011_GWB1_44_6 TaxID=1618384 RepID=A0A0G1JK52_9BACT|nr:MAG: YD repeat protein [Candidatus Collierbacteria bacterium GW2011_GWB1_44_6]
MTRKKHNYLFTSLAFMVIVVSAILLNYFFTRVSPKPPTIKSAPTNSLYLYQTGNKDFSANIGSKEMTSPFVSFNSPSGINATFAMVDAASSGNKQENNKVIYENIFPETSVTYSSLPNGIKEEIIITKPIEKAEYLFNLSTTAHPRNITGDIYSPFFFDDQNNYQFHLEKPFAIDAKGNRTEDVSLTLRQNKENKKTYQLKLTVSPQWLSAKDRAYPVTIDPTIVHDTSAEFAAGVLNRVKDTGSGSVPSLETFYQELPTDNNTVGLWHVNETSDDSCTGGEDACDSSSYGNDGTATGTTITTTNQRLGNAARSFNGTSDYLDAGDSSIWDFGSGDFTIEAWIKRDTIGTSDMIVSKHNSTAGTAQFHFFIVSTNVFRISYFTSGDAQVYLDTTATYTDITNWHHVAGQRSGNTFNVFLDGILIGSGTTAGTHGTMQATTTALRIGQRPFTANEDYFDGLIDEVRISNVARTPEEIKLAASRRPLSWNELGVSTGDGETIKDNTSLIAQWNFNETSGTSTVNSAGSCSTNCNLSLTGFADTSAQDATPISGWTSANKRWGAGALMFDKVNDVASASHHASMNPAGNNITVDAWVKSYGFTAFDRILLHTCVSTTIVLKI